MILKYMENLFYLCKEEGLQLTWSSEHFDLLVSFFPLLSDQIYCLSSVKPRAQCRLMTLSYYGWKFSNDFFSFSPRNIFATREGFYRELQPLIASYRPLLTNKKTHTQRTQNKAEIKPLIQNEIRFNQLVCLPLVSYKSISLPKAY